MEEPGEVRDGLVPQLVDPRVVGQLEVLPDHVVQVEHEQVQDDLVLSLRQPVQHLEVPVHHLHRPRLVPGQQHVRLLQDVGEDLLEVVRVGVGLHQLLADVAVEAVEDGVQEHAPRVHLQGPLDEHQELEHLVQGLLVVVGGDAALDVDEVLEGLEDEVW